MKTNMVMIISVSPAQIQVHTTKHSHRRSAGAEVKAGTGGPKFCALSLFNKGLSFEFSFVISLYILHYIYVYVDLILIIFLLRIRHLCY